MRAKRRNCWSAALALVAAARMWGAGGDGELFSPTDADRQELCSIEETLVIVGPPSGSAAANEDYDYPNVWLSLQVFVGEGGRGGRTMPLVGESYASPLIPGEGQAEFSRGGTRDWRGYRPIEDESRRPAVWFEPGRAPVTVTGRVRFLTQMYGPEGFGILGGSNQIVEKGWRDDPFTFSDTFRGVFQAGKRYELRAEPAGLYVDEGIYVWVVEKETGSIMVPKAFVEAR